MLKIQLVCVIMLKDVTGQAIKDYYEKSNPSKLWIYNKYGPKEQMPVETYFRNEQHMPELELLALKQCTGKVLDIGAGAGSHSLVLQQRGHDVTALDISPLSVQVIKNRGVRKYICTDIFSYKDLKYDTLLLLMNGIGLSATLAGLNLFLIHAKTLVNNTGQIVLDSSDVSYLYAATKPPVDYYYGEIAYQYSYKSKKSNWFNWLYVDQQTLSNIAAKAGWHMELLYEDDYDQYLAKLTLA